MKAELLSVKHCRKDWADTPGRGGAGLTGKGAGATRTAEPGREGGRRASGDSGLPPERLTRGGSAGDEETGLFASCCKAVGGSRAYHSLLNQRKVEADL